MYTWKLPCDRLGILSISSILPQILPQTSSQTQGNLEHLETRERVSRMEHQTPSVFPGNFRKRKVLGTLCFPFCLPEKYIQAKLWCFVPAAAGSSPSWLLHLDPAAVADFLKLPKGAHSSTYIVFTLPEQQRRITPQVPH